MRKLVLSRTFRKALLFCTVIIALFASLYIFVKYVESNKEYDIDYDYTVNSDDSTNTNGLYYNGEWYEEREGLTTWLFIGIDKYYNELEDDVQTMSTQADYLILYIFDDINETYQTIHINRDSMVDINTMTLDGSTIIGEVFAQITLAFTYGADENAASENVMNAASRLLYDIEIDNYLTFTMDVVPIITDMVGGVELEILDDYSHIYPEMIEGETVTLNGEQALSYIQTRGGIADQTNLERMERQAQFMAALEEAVREKRESDDGFYLSVVMAIVDYLFSDSTLDSLSDVIDKYSSYENTDNYVIDGEAITGDDYIEYYVDESSLQELVVELFYEKK